MDGLGDQLFPRAGFPQDHDGGIRAFGHHVDKIHDVFNIFAVADKTGFIFPEEFFLEQLDFFDQGNGGNCFADGKFKDIRVDGFENKIKRPVFHGPDHH